MRPGASAERDDGLMLYQKEEVVGELASQAAAAETPLELEDLAVRPAAQILNHEGGAHVRTL